MPGASMGRRAVGERPERRAALRRIAQIGAQLAAVFALLFVARFVCMGVLVVRMDQECHLGGIAVEVLAHGIRFPLAAYAPNEYDNGTFLHALLVAIGYSAIGRTLLVLPVLGVAELAARDQRARRLAAAVGGLALGSIPEFVVVATRAGRGWEAILAKADRGAASFPENVLRSLDLVADHRAELLA